MKHWWVWSVVMACSSAQPKPDPQPDPQPAAAASDPPLCSGQTADSVATKSTPRTGPMTLQLAPSFLDRMQACTKHEATPRYELVQANAGSVNTKGDCEWSNGVVCHFHFGAEFVDSRAPRPKVGELHCIFPSSEPESPLVYGMHFTCKGGSAVSHDRAVHQEQACGSNLLPTLAGTMTECNARCCDDGTLTDVLYERDTSGKLALRPDFRICAAPVELDCAMFAGMVGRTANAPHFGAPIDNGM